MVRDKNIFIQRDEDVRKANDDNSSYRGLTLLNDMRVLLISDPTTIVAECTLCVNVGSFSDPDDLPGLAHLCSRMILLGTEVPTTYSSYKGFHDYLSRRGGNCHTITMADKTYYYFQIKTNYFGNAFAQFINFFHKPFLNEDWLEEEINYIDDTYREYLNERMGWLLEFMKLAAKPDHPFRKFSFGNKNSLKTIPEQHGIDVRKRLFDFYKKYYSSNIMSLCIFSNGSLNEMEYVVHKCLNIVNTDIEVPLLYENPLKNQSCTKWYIVPKNNISFLRIVFPLPEIDDEYWNSPLIFLKYLLAYDGEGSFVALLNKKYSYKNITFNYQSQTKGINYLFVEITTNEKDTLYVDSCLELLFYYLNMIENKCNRSTSDSLLPTLYETFLNRVREYSSKIKLNDYKETTNIAGILRHYPMTDVILKARPHLIDNIPWQRSQSIINWILNNYVSPQNITVYILAKQYENEMNDISPEWCNNVRYKKEAIPEEIINTWKKTSSMFYLPSVDEYRKYMTKATFS